MGADLAPADVGLEAVHIIGKPAMFNRVFLDHPRAVNENYVEHGRAAARFGCELMIAGLACLVHAVIPAAFTTTASRRVASLHERMCKDRVVEAPCTPDPGL